MRHQAACTSPTRAGLGAARRSARKTRHVRLTMRLGLRVFFGFFLIAGLSAVLLLKVFLAEVKPSVREVMEDLMVDTANLLAEVAADEMVAGAPAADGRLAAQLQRYAQREVDAMIWGLRKQSLDLRIYVTDANGRVVLDSGLPSAVGQGLLAVA